MGGPQKPHPRAGKAALRLGRESVHRTRTDTPSTLPASRKHAINWPRRPRRISRTVNSGLTGRIVVTRSYRATGALGGLPAVPVGRSRGSYAIILKEQTRSYEARDDSTDREELRWVRHAGYADIADIEATVGASSIGHRARLSCRLGEHGHGVRTGKRRRECEVKRPVCGHAEGRPPVKPQREPVVRGSRQGSPAAITSVVPTVPLPLETVHNRPLGCVRTVTAYVAPLGNLAAKGAVPSAVTGGVATPLSCSTSPVP